MNDRGRSAFLAQLRTELDREHFEELAAIREFEGGFARAKAERLAWEDVLGFEVHIENAQPADEIEVAP